MHALNDFSYTLFKITKQPLARGVNIQRSFVYTYATSISTLQQRAMSSETSFYDFKPLDKKGRPSPLSEYRDKVVLVVNTASKCGMTPQLGVLEKLYQGIREKHPDFTILGFPCNQFAFQEPGNNDEIQEFCQVNYGVTFPILGKTHVNGSRAEPLYEWMKKEKPGFLGLKRVKWNFEKFLIDREGRVVGRWPSRKNPEELEPFILAELEKPSKADP